MAKLANTALRSFAQAQERLHCGRTKIYELVRDGDLELVKLGRKSLISERSISEFEAALLKQGRKNGAVRAAT